MKFAYSARGIHGTPSGTFPDPSESIFGHFWSGPVIFHPILGAGWPDLGQIWAQEGVQEGRKGQKMKTANSDLLHVETHLGPCWDTFRPYFGHFRPGMVAFRAILGLAMGY